MNINFHRSDSYVYALDIRVCALPDRDHSVEERKMMARSLSSSMMEEVPLVIIVLLQQVLDIKIFIRSDSRDLYLKRLKLFAPCVSA